MKVLVTAVGHRTEHWTDLFRVLAQREDVELGLALADVSPATRTALRAIPGLRHHVLAHRLGESRTGHMASVLFRPGSLARALSAHRPDVLHIIGEAAYLSTWQVIRWATRAWPEVPITLYAAQNIVMRFPPPFSRLEQRAYADVDHAFPITPAALHVLRAKGYRAPATIVPLGVDTTRFTPTPTGRTGFTVGFVGRLEAHKGIPDLLHAVEAIDANLLVAGRGSLSGVVADFARRRPGRVVVREWVSHEELPQLLAQMDVLTLPSVEVIQRNVVPWIGIALREQFGRALVEAMACGIPVVGSDVGEIPHVIGSVGLTFPAGDRAALTERLARLRDDPVLAGRLGIEGRQRAVEEFDWARVAESMYRAWVGLLRTDGVRPVAGSVVGS